MKKEETFRVCIPAVCIRCQLYKLWIKNIHMPVFIQRKKKEAVVGITPRKKVSFKLFELLNQFNLLARQDVFSMILQKPSCQIKSMLFPLSYVTIQTP